MEEQHLVSPSRQWSSISVGVGQGFIGKEQRDNIGASPTLPDLTPTDFYLFPQLILALKGRR